MTPRTLPQKTLHLVKQRHSEAYSLYSLYSLY